MKIISRLSAILSASLLFVWSLLGAAVYPSFYSNARKLYVIPDLDEGFIPQGISYASDAGVYLCCGYMESGGQSRLYVIGSDGAAKMIKLRKADGSEYVGHAGGVTAAGDKVLISNASKLFILELDDVLAVRDGDELSFTGSIDVPCNASFCSCRDDTVYVGEFHADGYDTDPGHETLLPDGTRYYAMVFAYAISEEFFAPRPCPRGRFAYATRSRASP